MVTKTFLYQNSGHDLSIIMLMNFQLDYSYYDVVVGTLAVAVDQSPININLYINYFFGFRYTVKCIRYKPLHSFNRDSNK